MLAFSLSLREKNQVPWKIACAEKCVRTACASACAAVLLPAVLTFFVSLLAVLQGFNL
jgi:hypothetical protein